MEPVRTFIIADSHFILEGMVTTLVQSEECDLLGSVLLADRNWPLFYVAPQVVLICTIATPSTLNCRLIEEAKHHYPESRVLVLGVPQPAEVISAYINAGINGYLLHDLAPAQLMRAVSDVVRYGFILDASFLPKLQQMLQHHLEQSTLTSLTERELEIVRHAVKGRSNYEIAADLKLSVNTVKTHLRNTYEKLNITSRAELAVLALSTGMKLSEGRVAYLA